MWNLSLSFSCWVSLTEEMLCEVCVDRSVKEHSRVASACVCVCGGTGEKSGQRVGRKKEGENDVFAYIRTDHK